MHDVFGREVPDGVRHHFTRATLAESLWQYGEDALARAAMELDDPELQEVQILAVWHTENAPDPTTGPRLQRGRIMARAMIEFVESRPRDTTRTRRRTRPASEGYDAAWHAFVVGDGPEPARTPHEQALHGHVTPRLPLRRRDPDR